MTFVRHTLLLLTVLLAVTGCYRGRPSPKPPIHPNPNMDDQGKVLPQSSNSFFADEMSMRPLVDGTVARGKLREHSANAVETGYATPALDGVARHQFFTGRPAEGNTEEFVAKSPVPYSMELLKRGQERYAIYCAVCHSDVGDGRGMIVRREKGRGLPIMPTNLHEQRILDMPDGQIYDAITNGVRNMPSYRHQIEVIDRWAIVAYVRALQLSQNVAADQLTPELLEQTQNKPETQP